VLPARANGTGVRWLTGGDRIAWHVHPVDQIVYPVAGVLSVLTGAGTWVLPSPGLAARIPAGTPHAHRAHGRTTLRTLLLTDTGVSGPGAAGVPVVLAVSPLLREVLAELAERAPEDPAERGRLVAVLGDLLRRPAVRSLVLPQPDEERLRAAGRALAADPVGGTVGAAAAAAGTSARTLSRLVRERLGLTFPQWRTRLRLAQSLLLLADGVPVTATAHRCGWRNASGYTAAFRAVFGTTPGRYQRSTLAPPAGGREVAGRPTHRQHTANQRETSGKRKVSSCLRALRDGSSGSLPPPSRWRR
jgi:AraC-like DNA-binding protein